MKKTLLLLTLIPFFQLQAAATFPVPTVNFEVRSERALEKLREVSLNPKEFLINFNPEGATISGKRIYQNKVEFYATKKVLIISKTVFIKGTIEVEENDSLCPGATRGFLGTLDFAGSDELVTDNFDKMELVICATEKQSNHVVTSVKGKILIGNNYNSVIGAIAREIINQQVNPLVKAIKLTIAKKD